MSQGGCRATGNMHRTRALIVGIKSVIDQTIYELGYIGDPSVLDILSESRFDNHAFIEKVRHALKTGETFR